MTTLAERQRAMRMRTQNLPRPKLTRIEALNQLAAQIKDMPNGPEKTQALERYLRLQGRRRILTRGKRAEAQKESVEQPADDEMTWRRAMRLVWAYDTLHGRNVGSVPGGPPTEEELATARSFNDADHEHTSECSEIHGEVDFGDVSGIGTPMEWITRWRSESE